MLLPVSTCSFRYFMARPTGMKPHLVCWHHQEPVQGGSSKSLPHDALSHGSFFPPSQPSSTSPPPPSLSSNSPTHRGQCRHHRYRRKEYRHLQFGIISIVTSAFSGMGVVASRIKADLEAISNIRPLLHMATFVVRNLELVRHGPDVHRHCRHFSRFALAA